MTIIKEGNVNKLIADEGYLLKEKNDNYIAKHFDENGEVIEEYLPYSFSGAYVPETFTLEMAQELYEEKLASDYPWK